MSLIKEKKGKVMRTAPTGKLAFAYQSITNLTAEIESLRAELQQCRESLAEHEKWLALAKCPFECVDMHYPTMPDGEPTGCEFCIARMGLLPSPPEQENSK